MNNKTDLPFQWLDYLPRHSFLIRTSCALPVPHVSHMQIRCISGTELTNPHSGPAALSVVSCGFAGFDSGRGRSNDEIGVHWSRNYAHHEDTVFRLQSITKGGVWSTMTSGSLTLKYVTKYRKVKQLFTFFSGLWVVFSEYNRVPIEQWALVKIEDSRVIFYMTDDRRLSPQQLKPSRPLPNLSSQSVQEINKCRLLEWMAFNVPVPRSGPGAHFEVP